MPSDSATVNPLANLVCPHTHSLPSSRSSRDVPHSHETPILAGARQFLRAAAVSSWSATARHDVVVGRIVDYGIER